jgi:hypothetical protein
MWRTRAIRSLLVRDIAALRGASDPEEAADEAKLQLSLLAKAKRKALWVIALDWIAILVLFLFRRTEEPFLVFGADTRTVFTLGILAVAAHSGFRLGQLEKYAAVERAIRELEEREPSSES